jgi:HEAT repeat protein
VVTLTDASLDSTRNKQGGEIMSKKIMTSTDLKSMMEMLGNKDGMIRQKARESFVTMGKPAVSSLNNALLNSTEDQVRWEAAKALGDIRDTRSIPSLVKSLEDSNFDVAWLAAEALGRFGKKAWPQLLRALTKDGPNYDSLRERAHHVFANQKENGFNDLLASLVKSLDFNAVSGSSMIAASDMLKRMKAKS